MKAAPSNCAKLTILAFSLFLTACNSTDRVVVYPVKGKVSFDGQPMKGGGSIAFMPTGGQKGQLAGGEIKEDGSYVLMTHEPDDGCMAGDFRVVITQVVVQEPKPVPDGAAPPKPTAAVTEADRIPLIYADNEKSPLTAKVEEKSNELNFDLKRS